MCLKKNTLKIFKSIVKHIRLIFFILLFLIKEYVAKENPQNKRLVIA